MAGRLTVETVVTTLNPDRTVNCAAMGIGWGDDVLEIRPYRSTRTFRNLAAGGDAVVNLVDDVLLFAQAALGDPHPPARPAEVVDGAVLDDACSWREVRVTAIDAGVPRAYVCATVVHRGVGREFLGLSRARHAVLEASILASRARVLPHEAIRTQLADLQILVDKTAGAREREAMELVVRHAHAAMGEA
ncbi:MAG TPA: DUF447 domain-containing protein [Solirubrobacteraceae bacterium]